MATSPSFGVDWYPEQWPQSMWASDADRMRERGIEAVRIMEFAWSILEPAKGSFDFSLFDKAIEVLADRGLSVILGTPTATFPAWLLDEEPSVLQLAVDGRRRDFGSRRMACFNSTAYREAARGIVKACAGHFANDPRVIGWQVDNEIGHEGSDRCVCESCRKAWHSWLARRYPSVEALNARWGSVFWGTALSRFDQAPVPRRQVASGFNPGLLLDYDRFCSDSAVSFVEEQVSILRSRIGPDRFITTNLYPPPLGSAIDMERLTGSMEFASWDNYPVWGEQNEPYPYLFQSFAESYIRDLHDGKPFTVMEEFAGIQGHNCLGHLPPEEQAVLWTNQAIARGADRIVYFRWRTAPYGQEQLCYGLFDTDNRDTARAEALFRNMREARDAFSCFASTPFESEACLVYSKDDARVIREQELSEGLAMRPTDWANAGYDVELAKWFAPFCLFNVNADVKSVASVDLARYRIISLPLYQMADPVFVEGLDAWVREGGHLVLGYRAGARDERNWNVAQTLPGLFGEMAGLRVPRFESLNKTKVGISIGLFPAKGEVWADLIEPTTARVLARYRDRRKFYSGVPCATVNEHGKGKVWYIGTSLDATGLFLLYRRILRNARVSPRFHGYGLEVVERRRTDGRKVRIVMNHNSKTRLVLGRRLKPFGWTVVE